MSAGELIAELMNRQVVFDVSSPFVYAGTLVGEDERYFVLEDADVHDLRDTTTTRELYVVEIKRHGINPNRRRVLVRRDEVVSLAALDDVLV
jgi:hypothetical protein